MVIVIVGPTGVGKTKLSLELATEYNTEIISGDSIQIYKGLDIGSAKIDQKDMKGIPHHLIDKYPPTKDYSVATYQKEVRQKIKEISAKGNIPIIVGGTGLYIKSVLYDYNFHMSKRDPSFEKQYDELDNLTLHNKLKEVDQTTAEKIHPNNRKRVLQALYRVSIGSPMSEETNKDKPLYDFEIIGLSMQRNQLYRRINQRVDQMIDDGLVEEVKALYDDNIHSQAIQAIGYKELYQYFNNEISLERAIELIKRNSRRLAKKQITFFSNQFPTAWFDVDPRHFDQTMNDVKTYLSKRT